MSGRLLGIVGPTASGKERVALEVAPRLGAEILSLDSMKIYRGMDIGTAKATPAQRRRVPHHLIDVASPDERFNVKRYLDLVERRIPEIRSRGREPLVVGGTVLYLKALLYGFSGPGTDPKVRRVLHERCRESGPAELHEELTHVDPVAARRIHPHDERRIVRALEVHRLTGRPISEYQRDFDRPPRREARLVGLRRERADLYERIDRRIDAMLERGLVAEVRRLREGGLLGREASQALGYKEILSHLEGRADLETARQEIRRATRHFARHQMTWLRRFPQIRWIDVAPSQGTDDLSERILDELARP